MPTNNVETARKFGEALDRFVKVGTPEAARRAHREVTILALRLIVKKSPVDTGRFRGNWQTSPDASLPGEVGPPYKDATALVSEADARLRRDLKPFGTTYITNNLPYAEPLENGHSKQAPEGMVAVTLAEFASGLNTSADEQLGGPAP